MKHYITKNGDETVLAIAGTLDVHTAQDLDASIEEIAASRAMKVTVDLAGLDHIESPGVAEIVKLRKRVMEYGGTLEVSGVRDQPKAIFKLLRLDKIFSF